MLFRRLLLWSVPAVVLVAFAAWKLTTASAAHAQQPQPVSATDTSTPLIKAETRLVLVDTVVTDKKGNYVSDLEAKDFKVWEDGKEQTIKSFSYEAGSAPNSDQKHYLVLYFDNSTMDLSDQARARDAAAKFIA